VLALLPPRTRPIRGPESIAEIRTMELGGFPQTVLLRGNDRRNPLLLYVHGGPGGGQSRLVEKLLPLE
jgi:L-proline amide hydrolase